MARRSRSGRPSRSDQEFVSEALDVPPAVLRTLTEYEDPARGSGRIRESMEGVREAVERINSASQEQSVACASAVEFLGTVGARTRSNEVLARRMGEATKQMLRQAEGLPREVRKFRI